MIMTGLARGLAGDVSDCPQHVCSGIGAIPNRR
jgi:hypothetical protein